MKNFIKISFFCFILLLPAITSGQINFNEDSIGQREMFYYYQRSLNSAFVFNDDFKEEEIKGNSFAGYCANSNSNPCYIDRYNNLRFYKELNKPSYYPKMRTIKVAIHVFVPDTFLVTSTFRNKYNTIINWLNWFYNSFVPPSDPILPSDSEFIHWTRPYNCTNNVGNYGKVNIKFEIDSVFYYWNNALERTNYCNAMTTYINSIDAKRLDKCLNIFSANFYGDSTMRPHGDPPGIGVFTYNQHIMVLRPNLYDNDPSWELAVQMRHEIGHNFGLLHTYYRSCCHEICDTASTEFLSDVFQPLQGACWQDGNYTCDVCNNSSPNSCSNNIMGGVNTMLPYFSPLQIGKMHRALALTNLRRYVKDEPSDEFYTITDNELWDFDMRFYKNIIIHTGKTLEITCHQTLPINSNIIVMPGAKLIIDGGKITNDYGNLWGGISVLGDPSQPQTEQYQGVVELKNGAIIENAIVGIYMPNSYTLPGASAPTATGGGIIKIDGANFVNCQTAIKIDASTAKNSIVKNSTFQTTQAIYDANIVPKQFMDLTKAKDLQIINNIFQNIATTPNGNNGNGILLVDAPINIKNNQFINLNYAINASSTNRTAKPIISSNIFNNNRFAIFASGMDYLQCTNNNFQVSSGTTLKPTYAIYLNACQGFDLHGNHIETIPNADYHYGVVINNGNVTTITNKASEIESISNMRVAIQAQGNNKNLQIACNNFSNSLLADIGITSGMVNAKQGSCISPASNTFSNISPCNGSRRNIWLNNLPLASDKSIPQPPIAYMMSYSHNTLPNQTPTCVTTNVQVFNCNNNHQFCTEYLDDGDITALRTAFNQVNDSLQTKFSVIDGGNTTTLLTAVNSNANAGQLTNQLLQASPYLSDGVLIATVNRSNALPPGHLKDVIIANSPITNPVMNAVNAKQLPPGIMNEIQAAQTGVSARAALEESVQDLSNQKASVFNDIMTFYTSDTAYNASSEAISFLSTLDEPEYKTALIPMLIEEKRCNEALTQLNTWLPITHEDSIFKTFNTFLANLCQSGRSYNDITENEELMLRTLEQQSKTVAANIQALLTQNYGDEYPEIIEQLYDENTPSIKGTVFANQNCGSQPQANIKLGLFDENSVPIEGINNVITNPDGFYIFDPNEINNLDSNMIVTIKALDNFDIETVGYAAISDWKASENIEIIMKPYQLQWQNQYSDQGAFKSYAQALDLKGNIYITGAADNASSPFWEDMVHIILKYNAQGELKWARPSRTDSLLYDYTSTITTDNFQNIYVSRTFNEGLETIKYDSLGNLLWSKLFKINGSYVYRPSFVLDNNNLYVVASINDLSQVDMMLLKYDLNGNLLWQQRINGTANLDDIPASVALDNSNNIYIAGSMSIDFDNSVYFVAKFDNKGKKKWQYLHNFPTTTNESAKVVKCVGSNVIVTGSSGSLALNSSGNLLWVNAGDNFFKILTLSDTMMFIGGSDLYKILQTQKGTTINTVLMNQIVDYTVDNNYNVFSLSNTNIQKNNFQGELIWNSTISNSNRPILANSIALSPNQNVYYSGSFAFRKTGMVWIHRINVGKYAQCPENAIMLRHGRPITQTISEITKQETPINSLKPNIFGVKVIPNPNNGNMSIQATIPENSIDAQIEIINYLGKTVMQHTLNTGFNTIETHAEELNQGIYMALLKINGQIVRVENIMVTR